MGRINYFKMISKAPKNFFRTPSTPAGRAWLQWRSWDRRVVSGAAARRALATLPASGQTQRREQVLLRVSKGCTGRQTAGFDLAGAKGLGRSFWLQAAQEKDPKKAAAARESAIANYS